MGSSIVGFRSIYWKNSYLTVTAASGREVEFSKTKHAQVFTSLVLAQIASFYDPLGGRGNQPRIDLMAPSNQAAAKWITGPPAPFIVSFLARTLELATFILTLVWVRAWLIAEDSLSCSEIVAHGLQALIGHAIQHALMISGLLSLQVFHNLGGLSFHPKLVRLWAALTVKYSRLEQTCCTALLTCYMSSVEIIF